MADRYAPKQTTAARLLKKWKQGVITLTRTTHTPPDPATQWIPGAVSTKTYELDATAAAVTVDQANAKYIDGTVITTADLVITAAVAATLIEADGVAVEPPQPVQIDPEMSDEVAIGGEGRTMKKIVQVPAAGTPIVFKLFVQG